MKKILLGLSFIPAILAIIPWILFSLLFYMSYCLYMLGKYSTDEEIKENMNKFVWQNRFITCRAKNPIESGFIKEEIND